MTETHYDPNFEHIRSHQIASLNIELQEYRHKVTAARHLHLVAEKDSNNVFLVAFLTVPQDSTGVAHILEHTALCGSKRFPVRDPFFMMNRRSLNTFMNAFTSADWTAYPFASQNKKDFNNLLDVYLDAAFFPLLNGLDFAQEGHRIEFSEADNLDSPLVYKGVVFNEMKGAMDSPTRRLAQDLQTAVFPTLTYHYNSGGEPSDIPTLTHEQLKAFHAHHYHPSNAFFVTYGDIPAIEHQQHFQEKVLQYFDKLNMDFSLAEEERFNAPRQLSSTYAVDGEEAASLSNKTHIVIGWLLGKNTDPRAVLEAQILADVLLDNSSSPLRHALETTDLGKAPSSLSGLDADIRDMTFACGLEGSEAKHADAVEALIFKVIEDVAENGVEQEVLESVLHQIELGHREVTGDGYPYGLSLILQTLTPTLHGGDPVLALDQDALLIELREDIKSTAFIKHLAQRLLLNNQHRVRMVMEPDAQLNAAQQQAESKQLSEIQAGLSDSDKQNIVTLTQALQERQVQEDDPEILPRVTVADVPADMRIVEGEQRSVKQLPVTWYDQGTNGMVYQQLVVDLPAMEEELLDLLPLYTLALTEVGVNGYDYMATQALQAAVTGGISAGSTVRGAVDDANQLQGVVTLAGKALARNQAALNELMAETFTAPRFDEHNRIRELVAQWRAARQKGVTGHGHALAMTAASAPLNQAMALSHRWDGLLGLQRLQALDDSLNNQATLAATADKLINLHNLLQTAPRQLLVVSEVEQHAAIAESLDQYWQLPASQTSSVFSYNPNNADADPAPHQGWSTSTQVSFCAAAFPVVPLNHPDAPALQVLGNFLRNGYLHRAIREQGGAYGGGAGYHADSATFRFFSYRDPRFQETLADFNQAIAWLDSSNHDERALEEAILGVIAAIDKPGSPAGEAITAFYAGLFGRTPELRRTLRQQILNVTIDDLKRVANRYLSSDRAHYAAISSIDTLQQQAADWQINAI